MNAVSKLNQFSFLANLHKYNGLTRDVATSTAAVGASLIWLQLWIQLVRQKVINSKLARKIVHVGSGPLFILLWPLYSSDSWSSRFVASLVPLVQIVNLIMNGRSRHQENSINDTSKSVDNQQSFGLADALSRTGDIKEALAGPLIYAVVLLISTLLFFRTSPVGVLVMTQLAIGDGMADIVGRKFGVGRQWPWPFSSSKSIPGSVGFVVSAFIGSIAVLYALAATGCLHMTFSMATLTNIFILSVVCAIAEILPLSPVDDNIIVPVVSAATSWKLFS